MIATLVIANLILALIGKFGQVTAANAPCQIGGDCHCEFPPGPGSQCLSNTVIPDKECHLQSDCWP